MTRKATSSPPEDLKETLQRVGQEHVLAFWNELDAGEQESFERELREIGVEQLEELRALVEKGSPDRAPGERRPAPVVELGDSVPSHDRAAARRVGEESLAAGKVGIFLVAGGQGTRLGFDGPKGCLPVAPLSQKTLFELHAEKIAHLGRRYGVQPPWYIMTSEANDESTREFFRDHDSFGLGAGNVRFVRQHMLPALDDDGRLILASRGSIFRSPNGHGGAYRALLEGGGIDDARARGVEHIFYFQVDNPLIRMADPLFLGLHVIAGSEYSLKVLAKTGPEEKVGVVAVENDRPCVVEYSDLSKAEARARDATGRLLYWAGTIAIHFFTLDFFERVARRAINLPLHVARKKIPAIDRRGGSVEVDGNKFETFVFDSLPHAGRSLNVEVVREEEFAPVKNRTGVDSLDTARELLVAEHRRWLRHAGVEATGTVEVSPRVALDAEELRRELESFDVRARRDGDYVIERDDQGRVVIEASRARRS